MGKDNDIHKKGRISREKDKYRKRQSHGKDKYRT